MKTERNILITFILNLAFSVFEFIGGIVTGSVAIVSDAIHDVCDAASIGFSYFFEKKSKKQPDEVYTYGYARYSVIGGFVTTLILVISSVVIIFNSINRIINPTEINYNGMIIFAVVGVCVNFCAALFTRGKGSLNQKAVNLHMIEDVLGWIVVLIGAVVMKFTDLIVIDAIMSAGVSVFILINAIRHLKKIFVLFLDKIPEDIDVEEVKKCLYEIDGVIDVHHIHIRSVDGVSISASLHVVTDEESCVIKEKIREVLREKEIEHVTIEIETSSEHCDEKDCQLIHNSCSGHCHHH
ncbi:MAG: cation transporter [Ruminococcaceae bacterium]|nr:cation transporter [Oscillospiraceae bacterium]